MTALEKKKKTKKLKAKIFWCPKIEKIIILIIKS